MEVSRTILFDFDGTIADTVTVGVSAFNQLAQHYGFLEITPQNADMLRGKGPRAAMKALAVPMTRVPLILRTLRAEMRIALPALQVAQGMRFATAALKEKGYGLGIVTSNSERNVTAFLDSNQIGCFDFIQAGSGIFGKAAAIKKTIARHHLGGRGLVFVGDEIRDIEAARKNKILAVGVTWGLNSREGLASAQPDFIANTTDELLAYLLAREPI